MKLSILLCAGVAAFVPFAAHAADSGMCVFIHKVLATTNTNFAPLKGAHAATFEDPRSVGALTKFHGTLTPAPDQTCLLDTSRKLSADSNIILPLLYDCTIAEDLTYEDAEARYAELAASVKACLPDWKYTESKTDSRTKEVHWMLTAANPGVTVKVSFYDKRAWTDLFNETNSNRPGVELSLTFGYSGPGPKGAPAPVMGPDAK